MPANNPLQQYVNQLLSKKVWGGKSFGAWLTSGFSPGVQFMEHRYENNGKPYQKALAQSLDLPEFEKSYFGTPQFELQYREVKSRVEEGDNDRQKYDFAQLDQQYKNYQAARDFESQVLHDLVPMLQRWSSGKCSNPANELCKLATFWQMLKEAIEQNPQQIEFFIKEVPKEMQPDNPQRTYQMLESGIRDIANLLYMQRSQTPQASWGTAVRNQRYVNRIANLGEIP